MAKYNIAQIQKMIDRLAEIGINTEKAILNMQFEDLENQKKEREWLEDVYYSQNRDREEISKLVNYYSRNRYY